MLFNRHYQFTDQTFQELENRGLERENIAALLPLKNRKFSSRTDFISNLKDCIKRPITNGEEKQFLKMGRRSLLRLERIIPNRSAREWTEALIFALVVAAIVRTFLFAPFKIPSGSMIPTIKIGDHIFAAMFSYGIPVPFTGKKLLPQEIERRDIVIFPYPLDPSVDYIKRVIAVGGDTIEIKGNDVFLNGKLQVEPFAYHDPDILRQIEENGGHQNGYGPVKIPPGKLFVMGDNRLNSSDSRVWGFVEASTVRGRGMIIYWSHDPAEGFLGGYRMERIGSLLE